MERIRSLNRYQLAILILVIVMALAFIAPYCKTVSRVGFEYKNSILVPSQVDSGTVYSGKIQGQYSTFTVSADKTVVFQYADKTFGPYTIKEDVSAIPEGHNAGPGSTGIELKRGEVVIFRGVAQKIGDSWWLVDYNDSAAADVWVTVGGVTTDGNGNIIDPMEPAVSTILDLINDPTLTHKGSWLIWLCGVFICAVAVVSILFADELFRLSLAFKVSNVDEVEPSDWEIAGRYIAWTLFPFFALVIFIMGLG